ncbi:hypothetical protein VDGD_05648 [Verticillium dahliae]|nr:60S ribosomal protein L20 [Verticillium dahliae VDG1]RBQ90875.1 hypothetical protein VDGD_05648 [Verticillium dahliae]
MRISVLALAAALPSALAFEMTSPQPGSALNLNDTSIKLAWKPTESSDSALSSVTIGWLLQSQGKTVAGAGYSSTGDIAVNVSQPRVTSYDWDPAQAREALANILPQGNGAVTFYLRWVHGSAAYGLGAGSAVEYSLEGIERSELESGAGGLSAGIWAAAWAGLAAVMWIA